MRTVEYTGQFRKDVRRAEKRGLDLNKLKRLIRLLTQGALLPPAYRDHPLKGNWRGVRDAHLESDWLILYSVNDANTVVRLERTGSHADLFGE